MNEILMLLLAGVLADNIICFRCIGIGNGVLSTGTLRKSVLLSLFITAASIVSTAVIYPVSNLLSSWNAEYFEIMLIIAVAALTVLLGKKLFPNILFCFTSEQGTVAFGTVMGICCISITQNSFLTAVLSALFYGIGLLLVLCLFFCARLSVKHTRIPKTVRGLPLDLIIVSVIALVLYGWNGVA